MKNLNYYLNLVYPVTIYKEEDGVTAVIHELPGCASFGTTSEEALEGIETVKRLWIEGRLKAKQPIPEPASAQEFSGKFVLRIPKKLHETLSSEAGQEGCSLNAYLTYLLSERNQQRTVERTLERLREAPRSPRTTWITSRGHGGAAVLAFPHDPVSMDMIEHITDIPEYFEVPSIRKMKGARA